MEIVGDRVTEMYRGDDPDQAKFFAERTAKRIISPRFLAGRDRDRWAGDSPSDKQINILKNNGVETPATKGEASALISQIFLVQKLRKIKFKAQ